MSSDLLNAYVQFYDRTDDPKAFAHLLHAAIDFDFPSDTFETLKRVAELKREVKERRFLARHHRKLESNRQTKYDFGTDKEADVIGQVERFLRGPGNWLVVGNSYFVGKNLSGPKLVDHGTFESLKFNPAVPSDLDYFDAEINRLQPVNIIATPSMWVSLTTHKYAVDTLLKNRSLISTLCNSDHELFCKNLSIPINDQMVDWTSGGNFYTCTAGRKHWLPFFVHTDGKVNNLLNLASDYATSNDSWHFGATEECPCGKTRMDFSFTSHIDQNIPSTRISRDWLNELHDEYNHLQFYEFSDGIRVFYSVSGEFTDQPEIEARLRSVYGSVTFYENMAMACGRKFYNFWRGDDVYFLPCPNPAKKLGMPANLMLL